MSKKCDSENFFQTLVNKVTKCPAPKKEVPPTCVPVTCVPPPVPPCVPPHPPTSGSVPHPPHSHSVPPAAGGATHHPPSGSHNVAAAAVTVDAGVQPDEFEDPCDGSWLLPLVVCCVVFGFLLFHIGYEEIAARVGLSSSYNEKLSPPLLQDGEPEIAAIQISDFPAKDPKTNDFAVELTPDAPTDGGVPQKPLNGCTCAPQKQCPGAGKEKTNTQHSTSQKVASISKPSTKVEPSAKELTENDKLPSAKPEETVTTAPSAKPEDIPKVPSAKPDGISKAPSTKPEDIPKAPSTKPEDIHKAPSTKPEDIHKAPSTKPEDIPKAPSTKNDASSHKSSTSAKSANKNPDPEAPTNVDGTPK